MMKRVARYRSYDIYNAGNSEGNTLQPHISIPSLVHLSWFCQLCQCWLGRGSHRFGFCVFFFMLFFESPTNMSCIIIWFYSCNLGTRINYLFFVTKLGSNQPNHIMSFKSLKCLLTNFFMLTLIFESLNDMTKYDWLGTLRLRKLNRWSESAVSYVFASFYVFSCRVGT